MRIAKTDIIAGLPTPAPPSGLSCLGRPVALCQRRPGVRALAACSGDASLDVVLAGSSGEGCSECQAQTRLTLSPVGYLPPFLYR